MRISAARPLRPAMTPQGAGSIRDTQMTPSNPSARLISRVPRENWTPTEDDILRDEARAGRSFAEIATKIGRTESAVRTRAYVIRVLLRRYQPLRVIDPQ